MRIDYMTSDNPPNGFTYGENTRNNARVVRVKQMINAGRHIFKIHMVDPPVVLMKVAITDTSPPRSFFGLPEMSVNLNAKGSLSKFPL
jgi:hypothetical protein